MIVTFEEYRPPARYDGYPWTVAQIYEAPAEAGPWTLIDTITFLDPDIDPEHPKERDFTTELATLDNGWYYVVFTDSQDRETQPTAPEQNAPRLDEEYLPSLQEVGLINRGRTIDSNGNELGTFNSETRPDDEGVIGLIGQAGTDVRDKIGGVIPADLRLKAKRVIAVRTAMLIELSYYSSEVATDRSPYPMFKEMYEDLLPDLVTAVAAEEAGLSSDDSVTGGGLFAQFGFDDESSWMTRRL
jgi:hypothetical protein